MRVLIVEDHEQTMALIANGLAIMGHQTVGAADGELALACLARGSYDIIVLDRMIPKCDGLDVLKRARAQGDKTPVLLLTALGRIGDRVEGLEAGADDYLVKPFAMAELTARLNAICRRRADENAVTSLSAGRLHMDLLLRKVAFGGTAVVLQRREFQLLEELVRNSEKFVTRSMLLQSVWHLHFDPQTNIVETHMSRLRAKLASAGARDVIEFARGAGYRLRMAEQT